MWREGIRAALVVVVLAACREPDGEATKRTSHVQRLTEADVDRQRRPEVLVAALGLQPGDRVVDLGAGSGYLTGRLAAAVGPTGQVVATEIEPRLVEALERLPAVPGAGPIEARLVTREHPGLEPGGYDLILMAQVDQYLSDRVRYLAELRDALSDRGRLAVSNRLPHRDRLLAAARAAGYRELSRIEEDLPGQYLVLLAPDTEVNR